MQFSSDQERKGTPRLLDGLGNGLDDRQHTLLALGRARPPDSPSGNQPWGISGHKALPDSARWPPNTAPAQTEGRTGARRAESPASLPATLFQVPATAPTRCCISPKPGSLSELRHNSKRCRSPNTSWSLARATCAGEGTGVYVAWRQPLIGDAGGKGRPHANEPPATALGPGTAGMETMCHECPTTHTEVNRCLRETKREGENYLAFLANEILVKSFNCF